MAEGNSTTQQKEATAGGETSGSAARETAYQVMNTILKEGGLNTLQLKQLGPIPKLSHPEATVTAPAAAATDQENVDKGSAPAATASNVEPTPGTLLQADFMRPDPRGRNARNTPSATAGMLDLPVPRFARRPRSRSYHDISPSDSDGDYSDSMDDDDYDSDAAEESWYAYGFTDPWEQPPQPPKGQPLLTPAPLPVITPLPASLQPQPHHSQLPGPATVPAPTATVSVPPATAPIPQATGAPGAAAGTSAPAAQPAAGAQVAVPVHPLLRGVVVTPEEETAPPVEDSLAGCLDDFWSRAVTDPDSLQLKAVYDSFLRPANLLNLVRTEINP